MSGEFNTPLIIPTNNSTHTAAGMTNYQHCAPSVLPFTEDNLPNSQQTEFSESPTDSQDENISFQKGLYHEEDADYLDKLREQHGQILLAQLTNNGNKQQENQQLFSYGHHSNIQKVSILITIIDTILLL